MHKDFSDRLVALPQADRRLLKSMSAVALLALFIGILAGVATALVRGGLISVGIADGYRFLTVHGVGIFFTGCSPHRPLCCWAWPHASTVKGWPGVHWRGLAFGLMLLGLVLSMVGSVSGTPLLYNGSPGAGARQPT
jgi:hypothetical protein